MISSANKRNRYLVGICTLNEGDKIRRVVKKFSDYKNYDVLIIDDGSDDGSLAGLPPHPSLTVIHNDRPRGAGYGTRQIIDYGRLQNYESVIFVSGNDKDDSTDVPLLVNALEEGHDLVQGSRYLKGGAHGNMPAYRKVATRLLHPLLFSLISGKKITDSTNGFRAMRLSMMNDVRLNLNQDWLDQYELEPYLFYKAIRLKYRVTEVPVKKIYPPKHESYTKMKPFSGWWSILRPLVFLALRIKQ